jgi:hypothetical protein
MFPSPASPIFLRRVADTLRAFALLEDPELEARVARDAALVNAHHRRPATALRAPRHRRRPGAPVASEQPCRTPPARRAARAERPSRADPPVQRYVALRWSGST